MTRCAFSYLAQLKLLESVLFLSVRKDRYFQSVTATGVTMEERNVQRFQGTNYMTFGSYRDIAKHLEVIKGLAMREDDVTCVGFPRTGNHWALEVISMILRQEAVFDDTSVMTSMFDLLGDGIKDKIQDMKSPRYFGTHFRVNYLPKEIIEKRVKIIYLMRNPKDIFASFYRITSGTTDYKFRYCGTWEQFLDLQLRGEFRYGSWFDHVRTAEKFIDDHSDHPVHILIYEELKLNPEKCVKDLCAFLGKSDGLAKEIAELTNFKNMKDAVLIQKLQEEETRFNIPAQTLMRSGDIGGWREYFTPAQSQRFDQVFKEKMAGSKLAALVSQYI